MASFGTAGGSRFCECMQERTARMERLKVWKEQIPAWDAAAAKEAKARWDAIAKPLDALGELEKMTVNIAGMQADADVTISPAALYVFCADNGIVKEGVTQTDASVTAAVARNMVKGQSAVCLMARRAGVEVCPVDVGMIKDVDGIRTCKVRKGTSDFLTEPSMSRSETVQTMQFGYDLAAEAAERGVRLLAAGEMGIGNTTTAGAITSVLLDLPVDKVCGRGAGLDDAGLMRKRQVIAQGIDKYGFSQEAARSRDEEPAMTRDEVLRVLSRLGGLDIAAMCGLYIGAACHRIPVIIDGAISAAAALTASMLIPGVSRYMVASHVSKEPAMPYLLEALGKSPVISADLAFGEGTGAVMLVPLLEMALSVYRDGTLFSGLNMEPYRRYDAK